MIERVLTTEDVNRAWENLRNKPFLYGPEMVIDVLEAAGFEIDFSEGELDRPFPSHEDRMEKANNLREELDSTPWWRLHKRSEIERKMLEVWL